MSAISYTDDLVFSVNMAEASAQVCEAVGAMSDHRLLEATRTGDEAAFAELVRRYRNQITNYVYRMTNDYDLAVDLAQETFMRVYAAADRYRTSFAFSTYIYRIATNLAISELRRRKRRGGTRRVRDQLVFRVGQRAPDVPRVGQPYRHLVVEGLAGGVHRRVRARVVRDH